MPLGNGAHSLEVLVLDGHRELSALHLVQADRPPEPGQLLDVA